MKLENKKFAAGVMAVLMAAAMPVSVFADSQVSASDVSDEIDPDMSVTSPVDSIKDKFGDFDADAIKDKLGDVDADAIKDFLEGIMKPPVEDPDIDTEDPEVPAEPVDPEVPEDPSSEPTDKTITWVDGLWGDNGRYKVYLARPGYDVVLPDTVEVTYSDGTKGVANVTWTEAGTDDPVDAKKHENDFLGGFMIRAHVEGYGVVVGIWVRFDENAPIPEEPTEPTEPTTPPTDPSEPIGPVDPTEPTEPTEPTTPTEPTETTTTTTAATTTTGTSIESVKTGEADYAVVWFVMMFSAAIGVACISSRKLRKSF